MDNNTIPYVVERMILADVPEVGTLERIVFTLPWSNHAFEYELQYNPMAYFVVVRRCGADADGQESHRMPAGLIQRLRPKPARQPALGYGGFWLIVDEAHICTLAVHPEWRGQGLGELLLAHLIDQATALNAAVATLEVRTSNLVAQQLYRKYGFEVVGLRKGYYSDNHEDALIMTTAPLVSASYQSHFQELRSSLHERLSAQLTPTAPWC
jgi:ribosomal-protein-alanine N-acetyltransferase